ncbi:FAD-dependent oxidoreductase [Streptomyces sp. NPDC016309]|uniref:FAD-dependent oxidoreductase n=1 Tax=Streptomyces sp. NPDC016309 TaxID=3364965 RepID=UPI0036F4CE91
MPVTRTVDVLVVGAGPAGLAAATRLAATGAGTVEVLEREPGAGPGRARGTAAQEAVRAGAVRVAVRAGAALRTGVMVTGWSGPLVLDATGPAGRERIAARAVVLATGARERSRAARLVPGTRPAGVLTSAGLRRSVAAGLDIGTRAVVVGDGPDAAGAVRALRGAGVAVAAVVTERRWHRPGAVPGRTARPAGTEVAGLLGRGRLSGVRVRYRDGREATVACDTVVFAGDWVPEHELARAGGAALDPATRGPAVDGAFRTSMAGVFAVGGLLHGGEPAGTAAVEGRAVAEPVREFLAGAAPWPGRGVAVVAEAPLRWVTPNRLGAAGDRFLVRAERPLARPVLEVGQDGVTLHRQRVRGTLVPHRSAPLPAAWAARVDPAGGPVRIRVV